MFCNPRVRGDVLVLDRRAGGVPYLWARLYDCICGVWNFRSYSGARWQAYGNLSMTYLVACSTGLLIATKLMQEDRTQSQWDIQHADKMLLHKHWVVACCASSHVSNSIFYDIMDDDRVLDGIDEMRATMWKQIHHISELPLLC